MHDQIFDVLSARIAAVRDWEKAPDDLLVGAATLAVILDRPEGSVRQAACTGRLKIPAVKDGRNLRFRVGDVRDYVRRGGSAA